MRNPPTKLHQPAKALMRLQDLIGMAKGVAGNDRDENRQAKLQNILSEAFDLAVAARCGGPLPPQRDHSKAV